MKLSALCLPGLCNRFHKPGLAGELHFHGRRRVTVFYVATDGYAYPVRNDLQGCLFRCQDESQVMALLGKRLATQVGS